MKSQSSKLIFLESIRGIAALAVVFGHFIYAFWPAAIEVTESARASITVFSLPIIPIRAFYSGSFAVEVFFVLSGFVLSYSYFTANRPGAIASAVVRRYFRLAFPSLVSVMVSYCLLRAGLYRNTAAASAMGGHQWYASVFRQTPSLPGAVKEGLYYAYLMHGHWDYNNVLWTMAVELPGSMIVYALLATLGTAGNRWIVYCFASGLLIVWQQVQFCDFILGVAICDGYVAVCRRSVPAIPTAVAVVMLIAGLSLGGYRGERLPVVGLALPGSSYHRMIGAVLVITAPLLNTTTRRILDSRPCEWLGQISFGLYLTHMLILASCSAAAYLRLRGSLHMRHNAASILACLCGIPLSLLAGWAMYFVADRPSIAIGRTVYQRLFAQDRRH